MRMVDADGRDDWIADRPLKLWVSYRLESKTEIGRTHLPNAWPAQIPRLTAPDPRIIQKARRLLNHDA